jgi:hypothetical protein
MKRKPRIFLILLMLYHFPSSGIAQTVYSQWASPAGHVTTSRTPNFLCTALTCPTITSASNTTDNSLTDYSTISFPVISVLSSVTFTMDLSSTVSTGYRGGVFLRATTSLVGLSLLPSYEVELLNNSTVVGDETYSSLLDLDLFSSQGLFLCTEPDGGLPYNQVRLTINRPIGLLVPLEFQLYYAFGNNAASCLNGSLPVITTDFSLQSDEHCAVKIKWTTTEETNTSVFVIQRRQPQENSWLNIDTIPAAGFNRPSKNYEYVDRSVSGGSVVYRLATYDRDGQQHFQRAKSITLDCDRNNPKLYYSLGGNQVLVHLPEGEQPIAISIFDVSGRLYQPRVERSGMQMRIDVQQLPPGLYILQLKGTAGMHHLKFLVQPH